MVFAFSVIVCVCLSVNFYFCQRFLSNILAYDSEMFLSIFKWPLNRFTVKGSLYFTHTLSCGLWLCHFLVVLTWDPFFHFRQPILGV